MCVVGSGIANPFPLLALSFLLGFLPGVGCLGYNTSLFCLSSFSAASRAPLSPHLTILCAWSLSPRCSLALLLISHRPGLVGGEVFTVIGIAGGGKLRKQRCPGETRRRLSMKDFGPVGSDLRLPNAEPPVRS